MTDRARVVSIGGIDPCGGAGITADVVTLAVCGVEGVAIAATLTVQNRMGLQRSVAVAPELLDEQFDALLADAPLHAVKTGLLADVETIERVAAFARRMRERGVPVVVDPVLSATAGGGVASNGVVAAIRDSLVPFATVVTPNRHELTALACGDPRALLAAGCTAVLVKGGHDDGDDVVDRLVTGDGVRSYTHPRLPSGPVHGTGCAAAAAIAARLALGDELDAACAFAVAAVARWLAATPRSTDGLPVPLRVS